MCIKVREGIYGGHCWTRSATELKQMHKMCGECHIFMSACQNHCCQFYYQSPFFIFSPPVLPLCELTLTPEGILNLPCLQFFQGLKVFWHRLPSQAWLSPASKSYRIIFSVMGSLSGLYLGPWSPIASVGFHGLSVPPWPYRIWSIAPNTLVLTLIENGMGVDG